MNQQHTCCSQCTSKCTTCVKQLRAAHRQNSHAQLHHRDDNRPNVTAANHSCSITMHQFVTQAARASETPVLLQTQLYSMAQTCAHANANNCKRNRAHNRCASHLAQGNTMQQEHTNLSSKQPQLKKNCNSPDIVQQLAAAQHRTLAAAAPDSSDSQRLQDPGLTRAHTSAKVALYMARFRDGQLQHHAPSAHGPKLHTSAAHSKQHAPSRVRLNSLIQS